MTQAEILPETKNDSPETQDFDSLSSVRVRFARDSISQVLSPDDCAEINPSIRAEYINQLTSKAQGDLPEIIRTSSDEQRLSLFQRDETTHQTLAEQYSQTLAETLSQEASGRMCLYNNYLYQLTEKDDWGTIYTRRDELDRKSNVHNVQNLQDSVATILAINGVSNCSADELKTLAAEFTKQKLVEQDLQEACWLSRIRKDLGLRGAVNTIKSFDLINREQEIMADKSWLGRKVMSFVGKTKRRLGNSALASLK